MALHLRGGSGVSSGTGSRSGRVVDVATPYDLRSALSRVPSNAPTFVFFIADTDVSTGYSWCPDTMYAFPVVMEAFQAHASADSRMIRVHCGDRRRWRTWENPFRAEPYSVRSVPTLVRWNHSAGKPLGRFLVDYEPSLDYLVQRFVSSNAMVQR